MKKFLIVSSFFLILISFSLVGYKIVSANEKVDEIEDEMVVQEKLEEYLTPYGYTLDNPNVVINPYGISPLTAMILFETEEEVEVTVVVEGVDDNSTYSNTFEATKKHYIPVYGLYAGKKNVIQIRCGKVKKSIEIETEALPDDLVIQKVNTNGKQLSFVTSSDSYPYALDSNQEVRWYLTKKYSGKIDRLDNGNMILSLDSFYNENCYEGLVEIDLFGKIYKQYNLNHGYCGSYVEVDNHLFVLSDEVLEFDWDSGTILNTFPLDKEYRTIFYREKIGLMVSNLKEVVKINLTTKKLEMVNDDIKYSLDNVRSLDLYHDSKNYRITKGVKFSNVEETPLSNQKIFLVGYHKIDDTYKNYQVNIIKMSDKIQVTGNFGEKKVYLILDRFMDKRVYEIKNNQITVHQEGLEGEYSIYLKIGSVIYKTNTYLNF